MVLEPRRSFQDNESHYRKIEVRGSSDIMGRLISVIQVVLIFALLRVVMLVSGATFFHVPLVDEALDQVINIGRSQFSRSW